MAERKTLKIVERGQERYIELDEQAASDQVIRYDPSNVDPYAGNLNTPTKYVTTYTVTPESRANATIKRTIFLAIVLGMGTGAMMKVLSLYPAHWAYFAIFSVWLLTVTTEILLVYALTAILDWKEQPASLDHKWTDAGIKTMRTEQRARLMAAGFTMKQIEELEKKK